MLVSVGAFAVAAALIVVLPGPDTMVVLNNLVRGGRAAATRTVLGVLTGLTAWGAAAALGLSAVLRTSEDAYLVLRIAGASYLLKLGLQALLSRTQTGALAQPATQLPSPRRRLLGTGYVAGLATDLLNPKVGVFFVTFLPGFIPAGQSVGQISLLLGAVYVTLTAVYFGLMLIFARSLNRLMTAPRVRRWLSRMTGTVLIGFAARLVLQP